MLNVIYFSNVTETTHRLVGKLDVPAATGGQSWRLPLAGEWQAPAAARTAIGALADFILVTPTYGGLGRDAERRRYIPTQVLRFLREPANRAACRGVVTCGNRNFGLDYGRAGHLIAEKLEIPLLAKIELAGDHEDVLLVRDKLRVRTRELAGNNLIGRGVLLPA